MKRLIHIWACLTLAYCQPAPSTAAEPGEDDKGNPIVRLTVQEALMCNQGGGCALITEGALRSHMMQAYQAGYRAAIEAAIKDRAKQCGRDA